VQNWQADIIITFDDDWLHEEVMSEKVLPQQLRAIIMEVNTPRKTDSNVTT